MKDQKITFSIGSMKEDSSGLDIDGKVKVDNHGEAEETITTIQNALHKVSEARSALGAVQNRLEHTIANAR